MLRKLAVAGAALVLSAGAALAQATTSAANPIGRWQTEGGKSHVQIYACGAQLCGRIVWLREPNGPDGQPKVDRRNPDAAMRAQKILGLQMLWNFAKSSDPNEWEGGRIYNPEDGETYKSTMKLRPDGKLEVRGYVGISLLGKSQYWERAR
ncbi:MAG: DUF2147 domain-containing protein [Alphaproteobacteria bacterium]